MCTRGLTRVAFLLTFRHIYWRHGAQAVTRRGRARRGRRAAAAAVRDSYLSAALQDIVQLSAPSYQKTSLRAAMTEVPLQTRTASIPNYRIGNVWFAISPTQWVCDHRWLLGLLGCRRCCSCLSRRCRRCPCILTLGLRLEVLSCPLANASMRKANTTVSHLLDHAAISTLIQAPAAPQV